MWCTFMYSALFNLISHTKIRCKKSSNYNSLCKMLLENICEKDQGTQQTILRGTVVENFKAA